MVDTQLIELKLSDIDKIMELQEAIINGLENKKLIKTGKGGNQSGK